MASEAAWKARVKQRKDQVPSWGFESYDRIKAMRLLLQEEIVARC